MKKAYFAIFFILPAFLLDLAVIPTHAVSQAMILPNHSGYLDVTTSPITYHIMGEACNTGTVSLQLLSITATFYAQNNSLIGSRSSYALLNVLLPSRKTPFEVVWIGATANQIYNYSLSLIFNEYTGEKPLALQILENTTYIDEAGFLKINGTVKNLAASNATSVKIVATFYDAEGKVVGISYGYTMPSTIMPSKVEHFELELKRKANFSSFSLTTESMEYAMVQELSLLHILILLITSTLITLFTHRKKHRMKLKR